MDFKKEIQGRNIISDQGRELKKMQNLWNMIFEQSSVKAAGKTELNIKRWEDGLKTSHISRRVAWNVSQIIPLIHFTCQVLNHWLLIQIHQLPSSSTASYAGTVYVTSLKVYNRVRSKAATGVLWQKLFFKTSQYSQENTCAEKRLQHRYFLVNIAEFPRSPVLKYTCDWLLISDVISTRLIQSNLAFAQPTLLKLLPIVLEQKYKTNLKNPQYLKI